MTTVAELKQAAITAIETRKDEIKDIAQQVLNNPETGFTEQKDSQPSKEAFRCSRHFLSRQPSNNWYKRESSGRSRTRASSRCNRRT